MTELDKLEARIFLEADGALHRHLCMGEKDLSETIQILSEEFARAMAAGEPLEALRAFLAEHGVRFAVSAAQSSPPYVRRANNQVPPETEALIRELLAQGRTKSAIARCA